MWKWLLVGVAMGCLVMAPQRTRAQTIEALESGSGQCGGQPNCLVGDTSWDVAPFTTTTQTVDSLTGIDTVTGSGIYLGGTGLSLSELMASDSGTSSVYVTMPDGTTVAGIFSITYSGMFGLDAVAATWQTDDGDPGSLGPLPNGAVSVIGTGGLQDITSDLAEAADGGAIPDDLDVQVQVDFPIPEPASLGLLSVGLIGLGGARRRRSLTAR